jgi:teichuronic acid biosynthesis glycosyltransferase TuaC
MKVLFISSMYHRPGQSYAGDNIHRQVRELRRAGVDVRVICPIPVLSPSTLHPRRGKALRRALRTARMADVDGVPVAYVPVVNLPLGRIPSGHAMALELQLTPRIRKLRSTFPFDVLHAVRLFPTAHVGVRIGHGLGVPVVVTAVGSDVHTHPTRNSGIRAGTVETITKADLVVSVSRALADGIEELARPRRPVEVVYLGVDSDTFSPGEPQGLLRENLGLPREGPGICYVGRLAFQKGLRELMEVFGGLIDQIPGVWLAVVGEGPMDEELRNHIRTAGWEGRVFMPGSLPHDEVRSWLNASDIFVLPSHNEGLPNVVLEAMSCERAVVATDVGGIGEAVEDGITGILVPPREVDHLKSALANLLENPGGRVEMGRRGRERVKARFSWGRSAGALIDAYDRLLGEGPVESVG